MSVTSTAGSDRVDHADRTDPTDHTEQPRPRWPWLLAVVAGIGVVALVAASQPAGPGAVTPQPVVPASGAESRVEASAYPAPDGAPSAGPAASAEEAVAGFLAAEHAGDLELSYTFLDAASREAFGSAAGWIAEHADILGVVTGFIVDGVEATGDEGEVAARVSFVPRVDPVVGLTPARAEMVAAVRREQGSWVVDLASVELTPILPDDALAGGAAEDFVTAAQRCAAPGPLIGPTGLVDQLCDAPGDVVLGGVATLDDPTIVQPFMATYGPDVGMWGRVVVVESPVSMQLVLAPLGDDWSVIGVARAR